MTVTGATALAAVLPAIVAGGLARQARRLLAARRETDAYLVWMLADVRGRR